MATSRKPMDNRELLRMTPGADPVVTCYLKLESRDRTRQKYLTKVKNRVMLHPRQAELPGQNPIDQAANG